MNCCVINGIKRTESFPISCVQARPSKILTAIPLLGVIASVCYVHGNVKREIVMAPPNDKDEMFYIRTVKHINGYRLASLIREILSCLIFVYLAHTGILDSTTGILAASPFLLVALYHTYRLMTPIDISKYQATSNTEENSRFDLLEDVLGGCV